MRLSITAFAALAVGFAANAGDVPPATAWLESHALPPDTAFRWERRAAHRVGSVEIQELALTSQVWRGVPWRHHLFVARPAAVRHPGQAVLFIGGGSWRDGDAGPRAEGDRLPGDVALVASTVETVGVPIAVLRHVPFQPQFGQLREDALIAHTFAQHLATGERDWPLLLPMVTSAVRAMDAVQAFAREAWGAAPARFLVTGASKRGWTTWLTAAVDPRVNAIAPMVFDTLDMPRQMALQRTTFGGYSEEIGDYTARGLQELMETPGGRELIALVDPWSHRERYTMPKLLLFGTNDRYWPLDACNVYWDGLPGTKWMCYCPNNGHGLADVPRIVGALAWLTAAAAGGRPMPSPTWRIAEAEDGTAWTVSAGTGPALARVFVWRATAPTRDFRDARWTATPLERGADGTWTWREARPASGYAAAYLETVFEAGEGVPALHCSTNVRVLRHGGSEDF